MSQRRYAEDAAKVPIPHCDTLAPLLSMARNFDPEYVFIKNI